MQSSKISGPYSLEASFRQRELPYGLTVNIPLPPAPMVSSLKVVRSKGIERMDVYMNKTLDLAVFGMLSPLRFEEFGGKAYYAEVDVAKAVMDCNDDEARAWIQEFGEMYPPVLKNIRKEARAAFFKQEAGQEAVELGLLPYDAMRDLAMFMSDQYVLKRKVRLVLPNSLIRESFEEGEKGM